jgi:hypothetical protein
VCFIKSEHTAILPKRGVTIALSQALSVNTLLLCGRMKYGGCNENERCSAESRTWAPPQLDDDAVRRKVSLMEDELARMSVHFMPF